MATDFDAAVDALEPENEASTKQAVICLEDHVLMFHHDCGGIVTGPLDKLVCAECGKAMTEFV